GSQAVGGRGQDGRASRSGQGPDRRNRHAALHQERPSSVVRSGSIEAERSRFPRAAGVLSPMPSIAPGTLLTSPEAARSVARPSTTYWGPARKAGPRRGVFGRMAERPSAFTKGDSRMPATGPQGRQKRKIQGAGAAADARSAPSVSVSSGAGSDHNNGPGTYPGQHQ